jgi:uncharacterized protein
MTSVFADTSFFIAIISPRDALHAIASEQAARLRHTVVTTEYVLIEVGNWLAKADDRGVFVRLMLQIEADHRTNVVAGHSHWFQRGLGLYAKRLDKGWSLTDCISFAVMQEYRLTAALTADHHFEQAGFSALLK